MPSPRRVEPAADMEHLVDDVENGARRQGKEQHVDIGRGKDIADDRAYKVGTPPINPARRRKPRTGSGIRCEGCRDAEASVMFMEREADDEHERERDCPGGG